MQESSCTLYVAQCYVWRDEAKQLCRLQTVCISYKLLATRRAAFRLPIAAACGLHYVQFGFVWRDGRPTSYDAHVYDLKLVDTRMSFAAAGVIQPDVVGGPC